MVVAVQKVNEKSFSLHYVITTAYPSSFFFTFGIIQVSKWFKTKLKITRQSITDAEKPSIFPEMKIKLGWHDMYAHTLTKVNI